MKERSRVTLSKGQCSYIYTSLSSFCVKLYTVHAANEHFCVCDSCQPMNEKVDAKNSLRTMRNVLLINFDIFPRKYIELSVKSELQHVTILLQYPFGTVCKYAK